MKVERWVISIPNRDAVVCKAPASKTQNLHCGHGCLCYAAVAGFAIQNGLGVGQQMCFCRVCHAFAQPNVISQCGLFSLMSPHRWSSHIWRQVCCDKLHWWQNLLSFRLSGKLPITFNFPKSPFFTIYFTTVSHNDNFVASHVELGGSTLSVYVAFFVVQTNLLKHCPCINRIKVMQHPNMHDWTPA